MDFDLKKFPFNCLKSLATKRWDQCEPSKGVGGVVEEGGGGLSRTNVVAWFHMPNMSQPRI